MILILLSSLIVLTKSDYIPHKDLGLNISQLVQKYGYAIEEHSNIKTEDGYLLTTHRISQKNSLITNKKKPVILLVHGLLASAECWLFRSKDSLPFLLVDNGYDVWLGNTRGTKHSRRHVKLNPDVDYDFWKYSYHQIGVYDLSAKIDYILKVTQSKNLYYVGHSQGTTSCFVLLSERPQYNDKIILFSAFAPIAFLGHIKQPLLKYLSMFYSQIEEVTKRMNFYEVLPFRKLLWQLGGTFCSEQTSIAFLCNWVMYFFVGWDWQGNKNSTVSLIANHLPDDVSTRQLLHYFQTIHSGKFANYDYGKEENIKMYGTPVPPSYNLSKIITPVALFYAKNDLLASLTDINLLKRELVNVVYDYLIPYKYFNHLDFLTAEKVVDLVYKPLISLVNKTIFAFST